MSGGGTIDNKRVTGGLLPVHETSTGTTLETIDAGTGVETNNRHVDTDQYETHSNSTPVVTRPTDNHTGGLCQPDGRTPITRVRSGTVEQGEPTLRTALLGRNAHIKMFLGADVTNGGIVKAPTAPTLESWNAFFVQHYGDDYLAAFLPQNPRTEEIKQAQLDFLEAFVSANGMMIMMAQGEIQKGDAGKKIMDGLINNAGQLALQPGALGGEVVLPGAAHMQAMCFLMRGEELPAELKTQLAGIMAEAMIPIIMGRMAGARHRGDDPFAPLLLKLKDELAGLEGDQRDAVLQQVLLSLSFERVESFERQMLLQRDVFSESWTQLESRIASLDNPTAHGAVLKSAFVADEQILSTQTLMQPPPPPGEQASSSEQNSDELSALLFGDLIFDYSQDPGKLEKHIDWLLAGADEADRGNFFSRMGSGFLEGIEDVELPPMEDKRTNARRGETNPLQDAKKRQAKNNAATAAQEESTKDFAEGIIEKNRIVVADEVNKLATGPMVGAKYTLQSGDKPWDVMAAAGFGNELILDAIRATIALNPHAMFYEGTTIRIPTELQVRTHPSNTRVLDEVTVFGKGKSTLEPRGAQLKAQSTNANPVLRPINTNAAVNRAGPTRVERKRTARGLTHEQLNKLTPQVRANHLELILRGANTNRDERAVLNIINHAVTHGDLDQVLVALNNLPPTHGDTGISKSLYKLFSTIEGEERSELLELLEKNLGREGMVCVAAAIHLNTTPETNTLNRKENQRLMGALSVRASELGFDLRTQFLPLAGK